MSDQEILAFERFLEEAGPRLEEADFAYKRRVIEELDLTFELAIEGKEQVVYIKWLDQEFRQPIGKKARRR